MPRGAPLRPATVALPAGETTVRGLEVAIDTNPSTGTLVARVPLSISPGRGAQTPKLSLSYSGGPTLFGGWALDVPSITRKTDRGLPRYDDARESDVFVLAGAEELTPALRRTALGWERDARTDGGYRIERFRPRVETSIVRVERWMDQATGAVHWRTKSADNETSIYGRSAQTTISDPADATHVFTWLLEETSDDFGNIIAYDYKQEDDQNVDIHSTHERNRLRGPLPNKHVKRIRYGNRVPFAAGAFCFQIVFDYGEHDDASPTEIRTWPSRRDAYSSFRAAFELRTHRLCRRVLTFHQFDELGPAPRLVRATRFAYLERPEGSVLREIVETGYDARGGALLSADSPPLSFEYTQAQIASEPRTVVADNAPIGLDGIGYQWMDLDGEGLPGILTVQAGAWYYQRNVGAGRFAPAELLPSRPSTDQRFATAPRLLDLGGDGRKDIVHLDAALPGFQERTSDGDWSEIVPFRSMPRIDWNDPNLRFVDIDGDGRTDILISEQGVFRWYRSLGRDGFAEAVTVDKPTDDESGPAVVFADQTRSIHLADMTGDGLTDIVQITNGAICYWPNLGYGRFGPKITMEGAPVFDAPDLFRQDCVRLVDVDGSGTADLVYLGGETVRLWINQSGNAWSESRELTGFPSINPTSAVAVIDLFGNGTSCLVWSSPLPGDVTSPFRYLDLMGGVRPRQLRRVTNGCGAEWTVEYGASTEDYLIDRAAGRAWATRLPSPAPIVRSWSRRDQITGSTMSRLHRYHHGYFDSPEREGRGFAFVEEETRESFDTTLGRGHFLDDAAESLAPPPSLTKRWFDVGAHLDRTRILGQIAADFYDLGPSELRLTSPAAPQDVPVVSEREANRARKGTVLREEIFDLDGTEGQSRPYGVRQAAPAARALQPVADGHYSVARAIPSESADIVCERVAGDTRTTHEIALDVDDLGTVSRAVAIAYPRTAPGSEPEQQVVLATCAESDVVHVDDATTYRVAYPIEVRRFEVTSLPRSAAYFSPHEIRTGLASATKIAFDVRPTPHATTARLLSQTRTYYFRDDLSGPFPLGQLGARAVVYESRDLALTAGLVQRVYAGRTIDLAAEGGYIADGGDWWATSGHPILDPNTFFLPVGFVDPFGNGETAKYDAYALLIEERRDALSNTLLAKNDYRVIAPAELTDPNGIATAVTFDPRGRVTAFAVLGKPGATLDSMQDPTTRYEYEDARFVGGGKPNRVTVSERERHTDPTSLWRRSYVYSTGLGDEALRKSEAEPGVVPARTADGAYLVDTTRDTGAAPRWIGIRRTLDRWSAPVKTLAPYFSDSSEFESEDTISAIAVTTLERHDAMGRVVRVDRPDGALRLRKYQPWATEDWDENDTVLQSRWWTDRQAPSTSVLERTAASRAQAHANTPQRVALDPLGRPFLTIEDDGTGPAGRASTRIELDIEGRSLAIVDALLRRALERTFDVLGRALVERSIDSGAKTQFLDVAGAPLQLWDARGFETGRRYDELRRVSHVHVTPPQGAKYLAERTFYGESLANGAGANLRGRVAQQYDAAGAVFYEAFDGDGNLTRATRRLARAFDRAADWSSLEGITSGDAAPPAADPLLDPELFVTRATFDARARPVTMTTPDGSVTTPVHGPRSLPARIEVTIAGAPASAVLDSAAYDEWGSPVTFALGPSGATRSIAYDPLTHRFDRISTFDSSSHRVQALGYAFDPVGNVTTLDDSAQETVFFANAMIEPRTDYTYDARYRLIQAEGRESIGLNAEQPLNATDLGWGNIPGPNDQHALRRYREQYQYDAVGNLSSLTHRVASGSPLPLGTWTRKYAYAPTSGVSPTSNRLLSTSWPSDVAPPYTQQYRYDSNGNTIGMPHLATIEWDARDALTRADLGGGGMAYFAYDVTGRRVRSVVQRADGSIQERIYLGSFETYRERRGATVSAQRDSLHIEVVGRRLALIETERVRSGSPVTPSPLTRYQADNHLGSACVELDGAGAIISYEEYHPFGTTSYRAARTQLDAKAKRYRYVGKERDDSTSFCYFVARHYAPWLGRWISCNPAGMVDGPCLYAYARNNPSSLVDPDGLETVPGTTPKTFGECLDDYKKGGWHADEAASMCQSLLPPPQGPSKSSAEPSTKDNPAKPTAKPKDKPKQEVAPQPAKPASPPPAPKAPAPIPSPSQAPAPKPPASSPTPAAPHDRPSSPPPSAPVGAAPPPARPSAPAGSAPTPASPNKPASQPFSWDDVLYPKDPISRFGRDLADAIVNPSNSVARAVMDNLAKRGEGLVHAPGALYDAFAHEADKNSDLARKMGITSPGLNALAATLMPNTGVGEMLAKGLGHLVTDTGEAYGDVAYYYFHPKEAHAAERLASRYVDAVWGTFDIANIFVDGANLAGVAKGAGSGARIATAAGESAAVSEGASSAVKELGGGAGAAPRVLYHYTNAAERSFTRGLWSGTSVTDTASLSATEAVEKLGLKAVPDKIIPIIDRSHFVPNRPFIVQPHPLGPGGGTDFLIRG